MRGGEGAVFGCKKLKKMLVFVSTYRLPELSNHMEGVVEYG